MFSTIWKLQQKHAALFNRVHLPVQYGGPPLQVPSSWQWRVVLPTSTPPGRQEYCSTEPYVQLWVPDTTALGGTPGSPQEIATEARRDGKRKGGGVSVCVCEGLCPTLDSKYYCIRWCSWVIAGDSGREWVTARGCCCDKVHTKENERESLRELSELHQKLIHF